MAHQIQILKNNVQLPNRLYYQSGATVILDDEEFAQLGSDLIANSVIKDLGYVGATTVGLTAPGQSIYDAPSTGIYRATISRDAPTADVSGALSTGVSTVSAVYLNTGDTVTNIAVPFGATAAVTPTHWFFALYSATGTFLGQTADQTTGAIAANALKDLPLTTPYLVTASGPFYIAVCVTAGTVPSLLCKVYPLVQLATGYDGQVVTAGTAGSAQGATAASPLGTVTAVVNRFLAYIH